MRQNETRQIEIFWFVVSIQSTKTIEIDRNNWSDNFFVSTLLIKILSFQLPTVICNGKHPLWTRKVIYIRTYIISTILWFIFLSSRMGDDLIWQLTNYKYHTGGEVLQVVQLKIAPSTFYKNMQSPTSNVRRPTYLKV